MIITPILHNDVFKISIPDYSFNEILSIIDKYIDKYNFVTVAQHANAELKYTVQNDGFTMMYHNIVYLSYIDKSEIHVVLLKELSDKDKTFMLFMDELSNYFKNDNSYIIKDDEFMSTKSMMIWKSNSKLDYSKLYYTAVDITYPIIKSTFNVSLDNKTKMLSFLKITEYNACSVKLHIFNLEEYVSTVFNMHIRFDDCTELYNIKEQVKFDLENGNERIELCEYKWLNGEY